MISPRKLLLFRPLWIVMIPFSILNRTLQAPLAATEMIGQST